MTILDIALAILLAEAVLALVKSAYRWCYDRYLWVRWFSL
jgi:hypothetical protein